MALSLSPFWNQVQELGILLAHGGIDGPAFRQRYLSFTLQRLACNRVSLWRFQQTAADQPLLLICRAALHEDGNTLAQEVTLQAKHYLDCFASLQPKGVRGSDDCLHDPMLSALNQALLIRADVRALACAALLVNGRVYGLLCAEQLGSTRHWTRQNLLDLAKLARTLSLQVVRGGGRKHLDAPSLPALPTLAEHAD